ncbi:protein of unknown function [Cupriavidus neocaledonicus]|uniref:Uncharacterized protein n=1 Tax=Cupriavidus neocaledonicus TaxID=1040979 RepID=A0A375H5Z9_9BURK|nr:protein of unknown function [Cupriavidus neocaledonicus]
MFQHVTMNADNTRDFSYWLDRYEGVARVSRTALGRAHESSVADVTHHVLFPQCGNVCESNFKERL